MPSEDHTSAVARALDALAKPREAFDSALALAAEEVRGFLEAHREPGTDGAGRVAAELGALGRSRIDADRLASLVERRETVQAETVHEAERAWSGLSALRQRGPELHVARVPAGEDLTAMVVAALGEAGRAFALARAARFVRNGKAGASPSTADIFPPRFWSSAERTLAPPLVVEVGGRDLRVSGLGDVLEGNQKIVLVVGGPAAPAPLARLIRPGLLVLQTSDPGELVGITDFAGPAVAAVMPEGSASFSHDPRRGPDYASRLRVDVLPEPESAEGIRGRPASAALEDLEHLRELSRPAGGSAPAPVPGAAPAADPADAPETPVVLRSQDTAAVSTPAVADPADRLASWLLEQAGLGPPRGA